MSRARDESRAYRQNFGDAVLPRVLAERLGGFVHLHTVYWYLRPFGASILLAGYDAEARRHELYCVEPTGAAVRYHGYAIGEPSPLPAEGVALTTNPAPSMLGPRSRRQGRSRRQDGH